MEKVLPPLYDPPQKFAFLEHFEPDFAKIAKALYAVVGRAYNDVRDSIAYLQGVVDEIHRGDIQCWS